MREMADCFDLSAHSNIDVIAVTDMTLIRHLHNLQYIQNSRQ